MFQFHSRWARRCLVLTAGVLVAAGFVGSVLMLAHEIAQSLPSLSFTIMLAGTLGLTPTSSGAAAQERIALEGYEVTVTSRPYQVRLSSGSRVVGWDLVVDIYEGGKRVAAITDNFQNGYGVLQDYGPQPGFDTPADVQAYWEKKDSLEVYWAPIDGLILVNNIPDAGLRRSLTAKWASLYRRIFAAASRRMMLTRFTVDGYGLRPLTQEAPNQEATEPAASRPRVRMAH